MTTDTSDLAARMAALTAKLQKAMDSRKERDAQVEQKTPVPLPAVPQPRRNTGESPRPSEGG